MSKPPVVACPQCGKEHVWDSSNRFRPFCCERCRIADLANWATEKYVIPSPIQAGDEAEEGDE